MNTEMTPADEIELLRKENDILREALEYMASEGCTMYEPCIVSNDREEICFACYAKQTIQRAGGGECQ